MTAAIFIEGERLRKEGKYAEAVVKYREVLAADESHVLSHLALAVVHGLLGEHDEAVASGRRACELEPDDTFNFTALSVTYKRAFDATQDSKYIQLAEDALGRGELQLLTRVLPMEMPAIAEVRKKKHAR